MLIFKKEQDEKFLGKLSGEFLDSLEEDPSFDFNGEEKV